MVHIVNFTKELLDREESKKLIKPFSCQIGTFKMFALKQCRPFWKAFNLVSDLAPQTAGPMRSDKKSNQRDNNRRRIDSI